MSDSKLLQALGFDPDAKSLVIFRVAENLNIRAEFDQALLDRQVRTSLPQATWRMLNQGKPLR
jgi:hypothetical protein